MPRGLQISVLVVLLAVAVLNTPAQPNGAWLRLETANFDLSGNISEAEIVSVAGRLERFREAAHKLFGINSQNEDPRIRVILFRDAASFRPFKPKLADGTADEVIAGYFQPGDPISYIAAGAERAGFDAVFHEYTHLLVSRNFATSQIRPWLNEGLAEYLQNFREVDARGVAFGDTNDEHLRLLRSHALLPWDAFFSRDNASLLAAPQAERRVFYAQAWAAVRHLLEGRSAAGFAERIRELTATGATRPDVDTAAIESGLKAAATKRDATAAPLAVESAAVAIRGRTSALSEHSLNARFGELLFLLRDAAAEDYLKRALAASPDELSAAGTLGMLRLRQGRNAEARELLERAAAPTQANYRIQYLAALMVSRAHTDRLGGIPDIPRADAAKMREYLGRAITLRPAFAPAHALLAMVGLVTGDDLEAALASARRAMDIEPKENSHTVLAARLLLRLERVAEARALAERVERQNPSASERKDAAEIIAVAREFEAANAAQRSVAVGAAVDPRSIRILKWKDLSAADLVRIEEERTNTNLNILLERGAANERLVVGEIERMTCADGLITYRISAVDGHLNLTGRRFDDLKMKVLTVGASTFAFRCEATLRGSRAVLRYRPAARQGTDGVLLAVTFVPQNFRLRTIDELAREPFVIVEGGPSSDVSKNARQAAAAREDMDRVLAGQRLRDIAERLRVPEADEARVLAVPGNIACADGRLILSASGAGGVRRFQMAYDKKLPISSYTPDAVVFDLSCRGSLPAVPAVITFRESTARSAYAELVSIEFVPTEFTLTERP